MFGFAPTDIGQGGGRIARLSPLVCIDSIGAPICATRASLLLKCTTHSGDVVTRVGAALSLYTGRSLIRRLMPRRSNARRMRWGVLTLVAGALVSAPLAPAATDPLRDRQWALDAIEADSARSVTRGGGAVIAVIDSGVDYVHRDLKDVLLPGYDFVDLDDDPYDQNGHGTHVVGILVARTGNGLGVASVAPDAKVLPLRVLNGDNSGASVDAAAAIDMAVERGAQVINLSVGEVEHDDRIDMAARRAVARDVVVVIAGDSSAGTGCSVRERIPGALCVASVDRALRRSPFSVVGPGVDISGPGGLSGGIRGSGVLSTAKSGGYKEMAGTSQAAPHVAGVAALLVSLGLRGQQVTRRLIETAKDLGAPGVDGRYGAGLVNARAAIDPSGAVLAAPGLSAPNAVSLHGLLKRGLRLGCAAARAGRCRIRLTLRTRIVGGGRVRADAGRVTVTTVRLNAIGRRQLRAGDRLVARAVIPGVDKPARETVPIR